ncbi:hypothetical protein [Mycolicibacterium sp.]|uniref:hypothetical protein n=1 Tax=Mycolicibacterium sp. TaxID=2320850 RepID=UPI003D12BF06
MFFITGLPCLFVAAVVFFFLTDSPAQANWLTEQQHTWLTSALRSEEPANTHAHQPTSLKAVVRDPRVLGMAFGAGGLVLGALMLNSAPPVALLGFCIGAVGCISTLPVFWSITPQLLTGVAAAGSIAFVCAVGNIGGFVAPYMVALIRGEAATLADSTNAVLVNAAILASGAVIMYLIGRSLARTRQAPAPRAAEDTIATTG